MRMRTVRKDILLREARCWPLYILAAQTAFQFLLKTWSEVLEIALFVAIVGAYLALKFAAAGPRGLLSIAAGTWTQRLAALFLVCLMVLSSGETIRFARRWRCCGCRRIW